jgi:DUF4097 and DUF4098 domain-containing protein YvlB
MGQMTPDRTMSFETPQPAKLRVNLPFGRINVTAEETQVTRVDLSAPNGDPNAREWIEQAEIVQLGDEIVVRGPKLRFSLFNIWGGSIEAVVHAPQGSDATLSIGAGRIETIGRLAKVHAHTGAGNVHVAECADVHANTGAGNIDIIAVSASVEAKTGAGNVKIGKVGADAEITTAAGNTRIDEIAGAARMKTAHGNIEVGAVGDSLDAFTSSGNVRVTRADHGYVRARTVSGGVSVGVANGVAALLDLHTVSGRVRSELEASGAPADGEKRIELVLSTVSGNVSVARAA